MLLAPNFLVTFLCMVAAIFFTCLLSIFFIKQCYNVFDFRKYKFFKMDGNEEQVIYALGFIPHGSSPPAKLSHNLIWKILIMGNK